MNVEVEQAEQIAGEMQDNLENRKNANLKFDHSNQESESLEQKKVNGNSEFSRKLPL